MPTGGAWKELLRASEAGNQHVVAYHLSCGIDPNWQHPEYFTAPVFEAIRHGHTHVVRMLIEQGGANPALVEELTDDTPLEVAIAARQHEMVDYLVTKLTREQVSACLKTIVLTGITTETNRVDDNNYRYVIDRDQEIAKKILQSGHRLVVLTEDAEDCAWTVALKRDTNNHKLDWVQSLKDIDHVHTWVHLGGGGGDSNDETETKHHLLAQAAKKVTVVREYAHPPSVATAKGTTTAATKTVEYFVVEPDCRRWYNRWTISWWLPTYIETILWVVMTDEAGDVQGKVFDYRKAILFV